MNNSGAEIKADAFIELGTCGMGMPVLRANQKMKAMSVGETLEISSAHP